MINSTVVTLLFSCLWASYKYEKVSELNVDWSNVDAAQATRRQEQVERIREITITILMFILAPAIFTHNVPALIAFAPIIAIYAFQLLIMGGCVWLVFVIIVLALDYILQSLCKVSFPKLLTALPAYSVLVMCFRLYLVFIFQTSFNYAYLMDGYAATDPHHVINKQHYLGIIFEEIQLRSQTFCNIEHAISSLKHGLVFFNWL